MNLKKQFGKRFIAGSWSAFAAVLVIVIAVVANLAVGSLPVGTTQIDLTENALYTLSDQSKRIAASVSKKVTLYLLASSGSEDATILRLMNNYAAVNDLIAVETVDPNEKPTFLNAYELDTYRLYQNSVIVDAGAKYRLVSYEDIYVTDYSMDYYTYSYNTTTSFDGENALTNAIHYVASDDLPKIYTLTGHGEGELSDDISAMLAQDNFETESLSLLSLESVPEDASAVFINAPASDLGDAEADLLIAYLEKGGSAVLITDYIEEGKMPNLLRVTAAMGLTVDSGVIIEGNRSMRVSRYPHYILPEQQSHEITESLIGAGYYILTPIAQPLAEAEGSGATVTWLLTTSEEAYAKQAAMDMTTTEREEGDTDGPFHVGAVGEKGGKLVWFTSANMLQSNVDRTVSGGNSNLLLNAFNWMGGQEESISIRAKSMDEDGLTLTEYSASQYQAIVDGARAYLLPAEGIDLLIRTVRSLRAAAR